MQNVQLESGEEKMSRVLPKRFRFLSQENLIGPNGRYTKDVSWVENKEYNHTSGDGAALAIAQWIDSIYGVDYIRFDGEGDGSFSEKVKLSLKKNVNAEMHCSEFNNKMINEISLRNHIKIENILIDALIPPKDGKTMVVIANQFLDALPFSVMRRRRGGTMLEELSVSDDGSDYWYEELSTLSINKNADLTGHPETGAFAYSSAKINYLENILGRQGETYLAVMDWDTPKYENEYIADVARDGISHSPTSPLWISRMARKFGGNVLFSDLLPSWQFYKRKEGEGFLHGLSLTIVHVVNNTEKKWRTCDDISGGQHGA